MDEERSLRAEIAILNKRLDKLVGDRREANRRDLASLEWAKGVGVFFEHVAKVRSVEYSFHLGERFPEIEELVAPNSPLRLIGNSSETANNLSLYCDGGSYAIRTRDANLALEFLRKCKPAILNEDDLFTRHCDVMWEVISLVGNSDGRNDA